MLTTILPEPADCVSVAPDAATNAAVEVVVPSPATIVIPLLPVAVMLPFKLTPDIPTTSTPNVPALELIVAASVTTPFDSIVANELAPLVVIALVDAKLTPTLVAVNTSPWMFTLPLAMTDPAKLTAFVVALTPVPAVIAPVVLSMLPPIT